MNKKLFTIIPYKEGMIAVDIEDKSKIGLHICEDEIRANNLSENKDCQTSVFIEQPANCNGCRKIVAATSNLKLEGVPVIDEPDRDELEIIEQFSSQEVDEEDNKPDLQEWVNNNELSALVDESQGGIIGYIHNEHINRIVKQLNDRVVSSPKIPTGVWLECWNKETFSDERIKLTADNHVIVVEWSINNHS